MARLGQRGRDPQPGPSAPLVSFDCLVDQNPSARPIGSSAREDGDLAVNATRCANVGAGCCDSDPAGTVPNESNPSPNDVVVFAVA